jgi:hypothetical protein
MVLRREGRRPALLLTLVGVALAALVGCSTTQRVKVRHPGDCVFLRPIVCANLKPAGGKMVDMRYVNPNAKWQQYSKVMIMPITFWGSDKDQDTLSAADRQALADYFHATLVTHLAEKFAVVDQPGPGVMKLQIAITDAEAATPALRTVSMVVPQARALNTLKYLATGHGFVGSAQGDALNAMDSWATLLTTRLSSWTSGTAAP